MRLSLLVCVFGFLVAGTASVAALGNPPSWAEENAKGYFPYHRLTAADFPIDDSVHREFGMYTRGFFQYRYYDHWTEHNGHAVARITDWNIWSGFDRNHSSRRSWFKRVEQTLPHEQGHLDLSELHAKQLAEMPLDKLPVGEGASGKEAEADLALKVKAIADNFSAETQTEQNRYDAETNHGRNAAKQREWTAEIQERLRRADIHF